ncbi:hypothetical protein GFS31_05720 [Leptolyngbya sp. BL0902]|uniref:hypothetical protein n=1 Tax=Leptolyngbya sp. BL0902 TaxID=1115757 RepID=UPI0018E905AE|nr:hypothetical protein [Leptolyngbya sp. BL0902]QQE63901.1 hypothetical protein GFS31_05720 [Leptolyngbya sp. BL0902]
MNAPADRVNVSAPSLDLGEVDRETAPAADDKICWIGVSQSPYGPDHQVELLHLQAEADALLLQLQTLQQQRQTSAKSLAQ